MLTYDDNQKAMKAHCLLAVSAQPQRLCLLLLAGLLSMQHRCYSTKVGHWRKGCSGRSRSLLLQFFLQKMFARLTLQFPSAYICICNNVRSVSFSNGGLRDRDIIFRDEIACSRRSDSGERCEGTSKNLFTLSKYFSHNKTG